jgi:hypothetical protein
LEPSTIEGRTLMGTVTVGQENSTPIERYYEDHCSGQAFLRSGVPIGASA